MKMARAWLLGAVLLGGACGGGSPLSPDGGPGMAGQQGGAGNGAAGTGAGGAQPVTCGSTAPCGGDLVGAWTMTSTCVSSTEIPAPTGGCPGTTGRPINYHLTGTVVYAADGTYTATTTSTGAVVIKFPGSCLPTLGVTCATLSAELMSGGDPSFTSASCALTGGACACTLQIRPTPTDESGTWSVANGVLTQTPAGQDTQTATYCVRGNAAEMSPQLGSSMMGSGFMETFSLTKQ